MTPLRKALHVIERGLEVLVERTKDIEKMIDTIESVLTEQQPEAKAKAKVPGKRTASKAQGKRPVKETATDAVLNIVLRSKKAVSTAHIKKKTGLNEKQIYNIINRAKKQGKIKSEKRGYYIKA